MKVVSRYQFYNMNDVNYLFNKFDYNSDYKISPYEIRRVFNAWDRNSNGTISRAEMENSTYNHHK